MPPRLSSILVFSLILSVLITSLFFLSTNSNLIIAHLPPPPPLPLNRNQDSNRHSFLLRGSGHPNNDHTSPFYSPRLPIRFNKNPSKDCYPIPTHANATECPNVCHIIVPRPEDGGDPANPWVECDGILTDGTRDGIYAWNRWWDTFGVTKFYDPPEIVPWMGNKVNTTMKVLKLPVAAGERELPFGCECRVATKWSSWCYEVDC